MLAPLLYAVSYLLSLGVLACGPCLRAYLASIYVEA